MPRLIWDNVGERLYETGVKNGVLYIQNAAGQYNVGYPWNGLTTVTESPSGAEATPLYADDVKYLNLVSAEEFGATVEAYMYPEAFAQCDGSASLVAGVTVGQQDRKTFGLCYKTTLGNDIAGNGYGYKLHIIYGCTATPSEKAYSTINDSPEAITFSWEINTTPVNVSGLKPTASIVIDSTKCDSTKLGQLEDILYGTASADARLPLPDEIAQIMGNSAYYSVATYFTGVVGDNAATTVAGGTNYINTLSVASGSVGNVIVIHNGADVTSTAYVASTKKITVNSVAGPIVIYATKAN